MKIYLGADHNGYGMKANLIDYLTRAGYDLQDVGDDHLDPDDDFPIFASKVCTAVLGSEDPDPRGFLICGSGQGMCMAANRFKGIRASLCLDRESARIVRNDDNANVLCLPAKLLETNDAHVVVEAWLNTPFANLPRFVRRLQEIDNF